MSSKLKGRVSFSASYINKYVVNCLIFEPHIAALACSLELCKTGSNIAIKSEIIEITTISSTSVKPGFFISYNFKAVVAIGQHRLRDFGRSKILITFLKLSLFLSTPTLPAVASINRTRNYGLALFSPGANRMAKVDCSITLLRGWVSLNLEKPGFFNIWEIINANVGRIDNMAKF